MALSIKNPKTDELARELSEATGEGLTEAVTRALEERLIRVRGKSKPSSLRSELAAIRKRCAALPVLDAREPDEILGYDESGLPT